jgi:putative phosphoserine phosphatase/1-acylglycerol-3-phosphate O-acyltransferase
MFSMPVVGPVFSALGGIPVDRGTGSDAPLQAAADALDAGELVVILPEGTIPRGRSFFEPGLRGRPGVARLAGMTDAPVVPVGLWGTEKVWPRSARLPNVLNVVRPPTVQVRVGPPVSLPGGIDPVEGTRTVMEAILDLLPAEARRGRNPTAADLARTYPPGHEPDDAGSDDLGSGDAGFDDAGCDDAGCGDVGSDDAGFDDEAGPVGRGAGEAAGRG